MRENQYSPPEAMAEDNNEQPIQARERGDYHKDRSKEGEFTGTSGQDNFRLSNGERMVGRLALYRKSGEPYKLSIQSINMAKGEVDKERVVAVLGDNIEGVEEVWRSLHDAINSGVLPTNDEINQMYQRGLQARENQRRVRP